MAKIFKTDNQILRKFLKQRKRGCLVIIDKIRFLILLGIYHMHLPTNLLHLRNTPIFS